jgi:hypothetical protein
MAKKKKIDPRMSDKQMPAKRMGQNESAEHLYQPQILREKEFREREGLEIPAECSPDRDVIAQRKKPIHKQNLESFGIKLSNLNMAGSSEKKLQAPQDHSAQKSKKKQEIKVSDFINEQKNLQNFNSLPRFRQSDSNGHSDAPSSSSGQHPRADADHQQPSTQPLEQVNLKNQYYTIYQQQ